MKFIIATIALCVANVQATVVPTKRDGDATMNSDVPVLNFALTLEHLENAFYKEGLRKYSQADFIKAGLPKWIRGRFEQIAQHEATHVAFLESALGPLAVKPCQYNFGDTSIKEFVDFSGMVETVGASAYTGAAQLLSNKDYLTSAAAILATEGRHSSWINSAVRKGAPWSTSFEAPLDVNQVYTIASGVVIPKELYGVVFAVITTDKTKVDDSVTVAGPVYLNFDFDSQGKLATWAL
ncbi:hypothetical protein PILCRDRAFT_829776 [Piloderma croceum F 1598]|uniref:Ferritin-like domain-containing protein n=1 Tax=Piloderma croceum (strain F 1598) TaxID=765440 RepID=A0A0C3EWJ2_PILCF|nr:hypothetical protein PILCRDRAFT_829776 [Piloderma croceum F 1598]